MCGMSTTYAGTDAKTSDGLLGERQCAMDHAHMEEWIQDAAAQGGSFPHKLMKAIMKTHR